MSTRARDSSGRFISAKESAHQVGKNIETIFGRRRAVVYALCRDFAARVIAEFRLQQMVGPGGGSWIDRYNGRGKGRYWNNQTQNAAKEVFSDAYMDGEDIGFFIAHAVEYGVYLELANDRRHEALRPLIEKWAPIFKRELAKIYSDAA